MEQQTRMLILEAFYSALLSAFYRHAIKWSIIMEFTLFLKTKTGTLLACNLVIYPAGL